MYDPEYGEYGDRVMSRPMYGNGFTRTHYVKFLASRRMGRDEPSPQEVLFEVGNVFKEYARTKARARKYSISISPAEVIIKELDTFHEELVQTKYIHYCVHDDTFPNIFAFVAWSQSQCSFVAHIFYCSTYAEAASLKSSFANGFQAAYREWKMDDDYNGFVGPRHPPALARPSMPRRPVREARSEYAPRLTTRALDYHRRSYEAPAVMEREQYRPPPRVSTKPRRSRPPAGPRPNQLIEVYGDPRQGGYDYYDDDDDDFVPEAPAARPAVEKEVVYTRETFPPPSFGNDVIYDRRNGHRALPADDLYATRGGIYGHVDRGRRSRRYIDNGYARDDMLF